MAEVENIEALLAKLPEEDKAHVKRLIYGGSGIINAVWPYSPCLAYSLVRR